MSSGSDSTRKIWDVKGTIRSDVQYLMVSRDVRRHRLISISYMSLLPCHGRGGRRVRVLIRGFLARMITIASWIHVISWLSSGNYPGFGFTGPLDRLSRARRLAVARTPSESGSEQSQGFFAKKHFRGRCSTLISDPRSEPARE